MKKVLVTGGAGFIGSHTALELVRAGMDPVIVDNFSNSHKDMLKRLNKLAGRKISLYDADCRDAEVMEKIFKSIRFDSVIHFAAFKSVRESINTPLQYYDNNLGSLIGVLGAMSRHGVEKFVFSSSCTVYGEVSRLPITEDTPLGLALSTYGATKQMGERIVMDMATAKKIKAVSLRYFNAVGALPSGELGELSLGEPTFLVPRILQSLDAKSAPKLVIHGGDYPTPDGTCIRDYVHVQDLARAHVRALGFLNNLALGDFEFFNIGTGKGDSVLEVIKSFERVTGKKIDYEIGPRAKGDVAVSYAAVTKARKSLGWRAEYSLEDSLRHSWQWQLVKEGNKIKHA